MFDVVHSDKHNFVSRINIDIYTQYNIIIYTVQYSWDVFVFPRFERQVLASQKTMGIHMCAKRIYQAIMAMGHCGFVK